MGAVFFMLFLAILFFASLLFIILSIVGILIWNNKERKGKNPKKYIKTISKIILIFNIIVILIPIGFIAFLRIINSSNNNNIVYDKSKKMLYWSKDTYAGSAGWFELDGVKYVMFDKPFSDYRFSLNYNKDNLGEPIANIKDLSSNSNFFNNFMWLLLSGTTPAEHNIETIYPIENNNGFKLLFIDNLGVKIYCSEEQLETIINYYSNEKNYDMQNLISEYTVFSEKTSSIDDIRPNKDIKENIIFKEGVFDKLDKLYDNEENMEIVNIPQKYKKARDLAVPGTPFYGYDKKRITSYSKDKLAYMSFILTLIDKQVYALKLENNDGTIGVFKVPSDMNQYLIDTVF